ncbi:HAD family hydrolase [Denitrobaculum tricleocarpae]|uniref:phosphoglycolate phosphatase n=1 Tax=Denitrobaculum tricleocarpae TaxID=2591009 RepID=A0A545TKR1_9PROT|nr:HAD family hydrolase [Denitrobaculum tricleocarpae]TQV77751.1 HAD family hydrolase [Denitrobaculum tricleocarpae]
MAIKGILFDKDGTLLDYYATWMPANREAALTIAEGDENIGQRLLLAGGYDPREDRIRTGSALAAGSNWEIAQCWSLALNGHRYHKPVEAILKVIDEIFERNGRDSASPVTDLVPFLASLKREGFVLGVATNDSKKGAIRSLGRFGVIEMFDFLAGYDSGYGAKPGPGLVQGFCRSTGLDATDVMVVGDNLHDIEMGRAANAGVVVGVLTGTSLREELEDHADHVLESIVGLESLLIGVQD